jgi:hypothetical protein
MEYEPKTHALNSFGRNTRIQTMIYPIEWYNTVLHVQIYRVGEDIV